mgnify:FL=1
MPPTARTRTHRMRGTPPLDELFIACAVCGMQVDADRTASPDQEQITMTVTGSTYHDSDVANIDKDTNPHGPKFGAGCWFCLSPNFLEAKNTGALKRFNRR